MTTLILVFLGVFLLNLIPAFAPPTWMVFSAIGLSGTTNNVALLAVVGAAAATLGRLSLAKLSRVIIRQKFLSEDTKQNISAIREGLQGKTKAHVRSVSLLRVFAAAIQLSLYCLWLDDHGAEADRSSLFSRSRGEL